MVDLYYRHRVESKRVLGFELGKLTSEYQCFSVVLPEISYVTSVNIERGKIIVTTT